MFTPYEPRPLRFLGIESIAGQRLKAYGICSGATPLDRDRFAGAWSLGATALPAPGILAGRPGVGFAILHQGATGDYFILGWWDRENELPTRVFVNDAGVWRAAAGGESFCVWDLRVMWHEREAYVATVLAGRPDSLEAYLAAVVDGLA